MLTKTTTRAALVERFSNYARSISLKMVQACAKTLEKFQNSDDEFFRNCLLSLRKD